jgi:hypothetical protein
VAASACGQRSSSALPEVGPDGQSCFQRPEFDQARDLQYKVAMTEWNWNGWIISSRPSEAAAV